MAVLFFYLAVINVLAFLMYGADKFKAAHGQYRISEAALIGVAFIGGSLGAWLGMRLFRHKTRKPKFMLVPVFLVIQTVLLLFLVYKLM